MFIKYCNTIKFIKYPIIFLLGFVHLSIAQNNTIYYSQYDIHIDIQNVNSVTFTEYFPELNSSNKIDTIIGQVYSESYDRNGNLLEKVIFENSFSEKDVEKYKYDSLGKMVLKEKINENDQVYYRKTREYNDKDHVIEELEEFIDLGRSYGSLTLGERYSNTYTYDVNDNLIRKVDKNGTLTYIYNEKEQLIEKRLGNKVIWKYDYYDNDKLKTESLYEFDYLLETKVYNYNENEEIIEITYKQGEYANHETKFIYDKNNIMEIKDVKDDLKIVMFAYDYEYDNHGNVIRQSKYKTNSSNELVSILKIQYDYYD